MSEWSSTSTPLCDFSFNFTFTMLAMNKKQTLGETQTNTDVPDIIQRRT
jgi:hypothetical protein